MKIIRIIACIILSTGIAVRLLSHGGGALLMLGTLLLVVHCIIYMFRNVKTNLQTSFLHLSYTLLTVYAVFRINYLPCGTVIFGLPLLFIIALIVVIICFAVHFRNKKLPQIFLIVYFVFSVVLSYIHSHSIYYFFNLNTVLNGETRNTDYFSWNKYSWFLYIADEQDRAIEANHEAQMAIEVCSKMIADFDEEAANDVSEILVQDLTVIKENEQNILARKWMYDTYIEMQMNDNCEYIKSVIRQ